MSLLALVVLVVLAIAVFVLVLLAGGLVFALILSQTPTLPDIPGLRFNLSSPRRPEPDRRPGGYYAINHAGQGNS